MWYLQKYFFVLLSLLIVGITHFKEAKGVDPYGNCQICGISTPSLSRSKKIINGMAVIQENKYPWVVSIMKGGRTMCGGAIISSRFILTAAHCFLSNNAQIEPTCMGPKVSPSFCYDPAGAFQVGVLSPYGERQAIQVERIIPHSRFSIDGKVHDIGLMKLNQHIQCSMMSSPICLSKKNLNRYGEELIVAGWGRYSELSNKEKILREGRMTQVQSEHCLGSRDSLDKARRYLCAIGTQTNQKSCFGDSGTSIFSKFGQKYFAMGVTSFGMSSPNAICSLDKPAVYTKTSAYMKWIRKYVRNLPWA